MFSHPQRGFGLVEIMMAMGLMALIGLGVTQLVQMQVMSGAAITYQTGYVDLGRDIRAQLANKVQCSQFYVSQTRTLPLTAVNAGVNEGIAFEGPALGGVQIASGSEFTNYSVKLNRIRIKNIVPLFTASGRTTYSSELEAVYEAIRPVIGPKISSPKALGIVNVVVDDATRRILECQGFNDISATGTTTASLLDICNMFNGTFDPATTKCTIVGFGAGGGGGGTPTGGGCTASVCSPTCINANGYSVANPNYDLDQCNNRGN